ncbi:MAG: VanZ family protein [Luteolibacter sp.]|uniref:VanZ family protein n=1 Tax=Luteolibacter sp. TaxID=1962973 RepID=UPI00326676F4
MTESVRSIRRPLAVLAATGFIVFFIWIVAIADRGNGTPWWSVIIDRLPYGDKVGHLGLIGTMSFLCNLAFPSRKLAGFITIATLVLLIALSLEELSQGFVKTRHLDFYDWLADLAGLAIGQFCAMGFLLKSPATTAP